MVQNVAPLMVDLESKDFYLLSGLEHGMQFGDWVNREKLPELTELDREEVAYRLDRCLERELIERRTIHYEGYRLQFEGYDALALHTLAERETIDEVGAPLGVGKESDVFEARNSDIYALKYHREGITNFREVNRERDYTADRDHVSWLYTARKAAEREHTVLQTLSPRVAVPEPIDQNRHALVMERIPGRELSETSLRDTDPSRLLVSILQDIGRAYDLGYVHADMSAYNIMISPAGFEIIDWPQAVVVDHPNADELLERDLTNLTEFFERKYPSKIPETPDISSLSRYIQNNTIQSHDNLRDL